MQDDVLFAHFTVVEALTFSARLKLTTPEEVQDADVIRIISELGLFHVKDSQIGSIYKKILSGGERKRTSIGVELVSDPSLIMLDEPTSGLDSFKARSICKLLHDLATKKGKTIVSTIHSPSSEAFYYFDRLILMADGYTVFQGDATESMEYFRTCKFNVPKRCNPADFFMKVLDIKYPKQQDDIDKLELLNRSYRFQLEKRIEVEDKLIKLEIPADYARGDPSYKASTWIQLQ
jgi:ABC-type multidrug transport system ATPase subunit